MLANHLLVDLHIREATILTAGQLLTRLLVDAWIWWGTLVAAGQSLTRRTSISGEANIGLVCLPSPIDGEAAAHSQPQQQGRPFSI